MGGAFELLQPGQLKRYREVRATYELVMEACLNDVDEDAAKQVIIDLWELELELIVKHDLDPSAHWEFDPRTGGIYKVERD